MYNDLVMMEFRISTDKYPRLLDEPTVLKCIGEMAKKYPACRGGTHHYENEYLHIILWVEQ